MNQRKRILYVMTLVIMMLMVSACASWKENTVKSYQLTGKALKQIYTIGEPMCQQGVIKPENCESLKSLYNDARRVYIAMGDVLILAINTEDSVKRQKWLDDYDKLAIEYVTVSGKLIRLAYELGILK